MALPAWRTAIVVVAAVGVVVAVSRASLGAQVLAHNDQALANMRTQAEAGDPLAQFDLGLLYHDGRNVPQDDAEAIEWYERAADQGFGLAQLHLGMIHAARGHGLPPDNLTACMWFILAASRSRGDVRNRAVELRDALTAALAPAQLAEAQRRAREWDAAHPRQR